MNPLNTQQQPAPPGAQYYITGMPPLAPVSATSILKTNITASGAASSSLLQPQQPLTLVTTSNSLNNNAMFSNGKGNSSTAYGGILDATTATSTTTKYVTSSTNYLPIILANQTLISSVDSNIQTSSSSAKVTASQIKPQLPVVVGNNSSNNNQIPLLTKANVNNNIPMVLTQTNSSSGNITYKVLTTSQNNLNPVITTPNGTVSVLLNSTQPMATAGHVAAPIIIRNTPTTKANTTKTAATTTAVQIKQKQHLATRQLQQHHQQQQQQQQKTKLQTPQSMNAEILKQIIVGNTSSGAAATLAPGTTLLKPIIQQQQQLQQTQNKSSSSLNKKPTKMLITSQQQPQKQQQQHHHQHQMQQKLNNHTIITTTSSSSDNSSSSQMFAALGMELVKTVPSNLAAQTVQKLPQVSLLQNNVKKSSNISEIINETVVTTTVLKNPHEIKVGNLNSEVSLIKKPSTTAAEIKSKDQSLLKNSNKVNPTEKDEKRKIQNLEQNTEIKAKTNVTQEVIVTKKDTNESSYSLLKTNKDNKDNSTTKSCNIPLEKQKSLLKPKNNSNNKPLAPLTSPRSQRSNSCNTASTVQSSSANLAITAAAANNERRHSEPAKVEMFLKSTSSENNNQDTNLDNEFLKNDDLEIYFEDEEYLESSGDKSSNASEKSLSKNNTPQRKEAKKALETTAAQEARENQTDFVELKQKEQRTKSLEDQEKLKEPSKPQDENKNVTATNKTITLNDSNEMEIQSSSDDDDVTILPMDEVEIEQIEIVDDDDEEDEISTSSNNKQNRNESLLCDEQLLISSSSSLSNNSADHNSVTNSLLKSPNNDTTTATIDTTTSTPLLKKTLMEPKSTLQQKEEPQLNGYSTALDMISNFTMLKWREKIGAARGTNLKFQLNEFNLIQLYEKSMPNKRIHTAYEKPIYERESSHKRNENGEPTTYYMCRRCNVQGPSVDFLAPEFCSLSCLKRDCRKRRDDSTSLMRKRNRLNNATNNSNKINNYGGSLTYSSQVSSSSPPPLTLLKRPKFRWSSYMNSNITTMPAPISLFLNPFPTGPNSFAIGMKLEAIDPENCALFCVCTIVDIMGYRLKLRFDGYDSAYDFWLNADSMDIFPPTWCAKTNRILQPPKGMAANKFNWPSYLNKEKAVPAPRHLFTHLNSSSLVPHNPFKIGMHLEAEDLNDTGKLCVASVADVLDDRIRIHFDGWDDCYDIIIDINSPYIHPCGWHEGRQQLVVPPDCENTGFNWADYIRKQGTGEAASEELFAPREPIGFKPQMRLEVVDPRNPSLIRPATVITHKGHRVKLHLDGWPNDYCFWLEDDSPDLHPIGWCDATGHDLEPPPGFQMIKQKMPCPIEGCRGIGNSKSAFAKIHANRDGCPYAPENWRIVLEKPQRINYENIIRSLPKQSKQPISHQNAPTQQQQPRLSEQQILERLQMLDNIKTRNVLVQQEKLPTNHSDLLGGFSLPNIKKEEVKDNKFLKISKTSSSSSTVSDTPAPLDLNLEINKEFLVDYGPRLQQNYNLWQKNFTFDADKIKRNPLKWSTTEVSVFVDLYMKCRNTATRFSQEDIDGEAFLLLEQQDLTDKLNMKLGPAVRLYTCILQLRTLAVTKFEVPYKREGANKVKK